MTLANRLCGAAVRKCEAPYRSPKEFMVGAEAQLWLDTNELQYPFHGFSVDSSNYHLYPEFQSLELRRAYAGYAGVDPDQVLVVRGADEGIELLIRAFCTPAEDQVVCLQPTYAMYHLTAAMYNVGVVNIARTADFDVDVGEVKRQGAGKLIFICSPNNPTGNLLSIEQLIDLLEHFKESAIVVIDEAYVEFCPSLTCTHLIDRYPNLAVIRTLSKAFGLAALRCGFLLSTREVVAVVRRVMAPYPLAEPVAQIAIQALSAESRRRMEASVARILATSRDFVAALEKLDCVRSVTPVLGNFVLVQFREEGVDVEMIARQGINIRKLIPGYGLTKLHRRISIGTEAQMARLLAVMQKLDRKSRRAAMSIPTSAGLEAPML